MGTAAQWIALTFLGWAGSLFNYILSPEFNQVPLTKSSFVVEAWTITRNFANMFFMLIMLAIAFATILRIDIAGMNIKKTLPRLIIAALLINFSRVIAGVIIDAGQIIMLTFTQGASQEGNLADFLISQTKTGTLFASPGFMEGFASSSVTESLKAIASVWFSAAFIGFAAFIFFMLTIMLIVRVVALWLLIILAPIAWLAFIIPQGAGYWKQWWDMFLRQTFFGAIIAFFIFLSAKMAANLSAIQQFKEEIGTDIDTSSKFLSNTSYILQYLTIVIMLYLSYFVAKKVNSMGVNMTFKALSGAAAVAKRTPVGDDMWRGMEKRVAYSREKGLLRFVAPHPRAVEKRAEYWAQKFGVPEEEFQKQKFYQSEIKYRNETDEIVKRDALESPTKISPIDKAAAIQEAGRRKLIPKERLRQEEESQRRYAAIKRGVSAEKIEAEMKIAQRLDLSIEQEITQKAQKRGETDPEKIKNEVQIALKNTISNLNTKELMETLLKQPVEFYQSVNVQKAIPDAMTPEQMQQFLNNATKAQSAPIAEKLRKILAEEKAARKKGTTQEKTAKEKFDDLFKK